MHRPLAALVLLGAVHCDAASPSATGTPTDTADTGPDRNQAVSCALVERDDGSDDSVDGLQWLAFNHLNELLIENSDFDADGSDNIQATHSYAGDRRTTATLYDLDGDGILQGVAHQVLVLPSDVLSESTLDGNGDGTLESELQTLAFTAAGDPSDQLWMVTGSEPESRALTYDGQRRVTALEIDRGDDGGVDWRQTTTYGATIHAVETDTDGNGATDEVEETHVDAEGRITLWRSDYPLGEPWEVVDTYTYDRSGLVSVVRERTDGGGITTTYTRDTDGRVLEEVVTYVGGTPTTSRWTWQDCPADAR